MLTAEKKERGAMVQAMLEWAGPSKERPRSQSTREGVPKVEHPRLALVGTVLVKGEVKSAVVGRSVVAEGRHVPRQERKVLARLLRRGRAQTRVVLDRPRLRRRRGLAPALVLCIRCVAQWRSDRPLSGPLARPPPRLASHEPAIVKKETSSFRRRTLMSGVAKLRRNPSARVRSGQKRWNRFMTRPLMWAPSAS